MKRLFLICTALFMVSALYAETIEKEFSVDGIPNFSLSNISGNITVLQGNNDEVIVKADNPNPEVEVLFEQSGNRITVETKYPNNSRNIRKGVTFEVWLPQNSDAELNSVSGTIRLEAIEGRIDMNSVSGDIIVKDTVGNLKLNSVSGDILVKGLDSSDLEAQTVSGNMELSGLVLESGNYDLNTVSGDVEIWHGSSASYSISGESLSGDMDIRGGIDGLKIKKAKYVGNQSLSGSFNGGKADIDFSSVSGGLTLGIQ